ncbi:MAG TPA: pyridoxine 5'-phosphate synthase [Burkholderiales bacterium]|nr:pyridoxine 5'-phosphate synthase [Burkholderiales bacterium]
MIRLGVNIDHIATIRNARGESFPSVVEAGLVAETSGADLITVHLREDRRHIKDEDVLLLRKSLKTELNLEMAATKNMLDFALKIHPEYVCLVPEKRQELTTEGGLDVINNYENIAEIVKILSKNNILVSIFVDADVKQITACREINSYAIEIHTGRYANEKSNYNNSQEFYKIKDMAEFADSLGLVVNAGHGLNYHNVKPIACIPQIRELNIGFSIIAQSVFWGLPKAVAEMKRLMLEERI